MEVMAQAIALVKMLSVEVDKRLEQSILGGLKPIKLKSTVYCGRPMRDRDQCLPDRLMRLPDKSNKFVELS